jgi:hypothetical protein
MSDPHEQTGVMATKRYAATQGQARAFGESILESMRQAPFGALPKSELELALFRAMVDAGILDPGNPTFDLARKLEITPARVRGLVYRYRLMTQGDEADTLDDVVRALSKTRFELTGESITFGVEDPYLRDSLAAAFKQRGIFADSSFNPETVRLSLTAFVEFVDSRLGDDDRKRILAAITHDTHVELSKFRRILKSTLASLGKRLVGAAADEAASDLVDAAWQFTSGLFGADSADAVAAAHRFE